MKRKDVTRNGEDVGYTAKELKTIQTNLNSILNDGKRGIVIVALEVKGKGLLIQGGIRKLSKKQALDIASEALGLSQVETALLAMSDDHTFSSEEKPSKKAPKKKVAKKAVNKVSKRK